MIIQDDCLEKTKICSKCGEVKPICEFGEGRRQCRVCKNLYNKEYRLKTKEYQKKYQKKYRLKTNTERVKHFKEYCLKNKDKKRIYAQEYRLKNKDKFKEYYLKNKDKIKKQAKEHYLKNKDKVIEQLRIYRLKNKDKVKEYNKEYNERYYLKNKEKIGEYRLKNRERDLEYIKLKRKTDLKFRLNMNISTAIRTSLHGNKNGRHWEDLVGFNLTQLKRHLEKQFIESMTWDNYGEWHIDHKIPKSAFNFTKPEHTGFKKCWALENLQPMWAKDNFSKHDKLYYDFQRHLAI